MGAVDDDAERGIRDWGSCWVVCTSGADPSLMVAGRSPRLADEVTAAIAGALDAQTITLAGEDTWGEIIVGLVADPDRIHTRRHELGKQIETASSNTVSDRSW